MTVTVFIQSCKCFQLNAEILVNKTVYITVCYHNDIHLLKQGCNCILLIDLTCGPIVQNITVCLSV